MDFEVYGYEDSSIAYVSRVMGVVASRMSVGKSHMGSGAWRREIGTTTLRVAYYRDLAYHTPCTVSVPHFMAYRMPSQYRTQR
eukprot:72454-Rhodomonas_salina.1